MRASHLRESDSALGERPQLVVPRRVASQESEALAHGILDVLVHGSPKLHQATAAVPGRTRADETAVLAERGRADARARSR